MCDEIVELSKEKLLNVFRLKLLNYNWDLEIHSNINGGILVKEWRTNCMWSEDK